MTQMITRVTLRLAFLSLLPMLGTGCMSGRTDLVRAGEALLDAQDSRSARFLWVRAWEIEDEPHPREYEVSGVLVQRSQNRLPIRGHVHAEAVDSDGQKVAEGFDRVTTQRLGLGIVSAAVSGCPSAGFRRSRRFVCTTTPGPMNTRILISA